MILKDLECPEPNASNSDICTTYQKDNLTTITVQELEEMNIIW